VRLFFPLYIRADQSHYSDGGGLTLTLSHLSSGIVVNSGDVQIKASGNIGVYAVNPSGTTMMPGNVFARVSRFLMEGIRGLLRLMGINDSWG